MPKSAARHFDARLRPDSTTFPARICYSRTAVASLPLRSPRRLSLSRPAPPPSSPSPLPPPPQFPPHTPLPIRDAPRREGFVYSGAFAAKHGPGKYLNPLFVPFDDTGMHPHTIAHFEFRDVALLLLFANSIDDVHRRILRWKRGRIRSAG